MTVNALQGVLCMSGRSENVITDNAEPAGMRVSVSRVGSVIYL